VEIIQSSKGFDYKIAETLKNGYRDSYVLLVASQYQLKNYPEVLLLAEKGIDANLEKGGALHYYAGLGSYQLKEYEHSFSFLKESIRRDPNDAQAYYHLGLSLQALGKKQMAEETFQKAAYLQSIKSQSRSKEDNIRIQIF